MRIAIIGPAHPYKGGIPLHTTELAHRLQAAGHDVRLISWKSQYPNFLYPGEQRLSASKPEMPLFEHTSAPLKWYDPTSWWRVGRSLRGFDLVVITYFVPHFQGTSGLAIMRAMGRGKSRPRVVALCHNVVQHDPRPGEARINKLFLGRVDAVVVHSNHQAALARQFTSKPIRVLAMAPHLPANAHATGSKTTKLKHRLLFFGLVRKYKGLDILLQALAQIPDVQLTIAGEAWDKMKLAIDTQIEELGLQSRVDFRAGYLPSEKLPAFFAEGDALVLPYRGGSGTQNVEMGFAHGVPVIATNAALHPGQIDDGVNGLICKPGDLNSLVKAIKHFYEPGVAEKLRAHVPKPSADKEWSEYIAGLLAAA